MSEIFGTLFARLAAVLSLLAVVAVLYVVNGTDKTQKNIQQIAHTQGEILGLYNGKNNYTTLNNTVVMQGKLAPADMFPAGALINPWSGNITIAADANPAQFYISEQNVPNDACAKVATGIGNYLSLQINGGSVYTSGAQLDPGSATAECSTTADANTLKFVFGS